MTDNRKYICHHVRELHAYVPGEQPKVSGLIKLNTNENPYPPSPGVTAVIGSLGNDAARLYPDPMCTALREAISGEVGCDSGNVFVGNGSDEVLALCTRAFVEDDGKIGCFDPTYSLYPVLSAIRDVRIDPVDLNDDFTWRMPDGYTAPLFFLTNPNAPTGMLFPRDEIVLFCDAFEGVVLIDEAYADFAEWNCMDLALSRPNVIVSRSFSKSYSLAGMRCGYAVGPAPLIEAFYKVKDSYNVNAVTQAAALAAFKDQAYMRGNVEKIVATRARVAAELKKRGYDVCSSATNFLWVKPPGSAQQVFAELREKKVLVRYFPGEKTGNFLRVTIGTDEQMNAFLAALG